MYRYTNNPTQNKNFNNDLSFTIEKNDKQVILNGKRKKIIALKEIKI